MKTKTVPIEKPTLPVRIVEDKFRGTVAIVDADGQTVCIPLYECAPFIVRALNKSRA